MKIRNKKKRRKNSQYIWLGVAVVSSICFFAALLRFIKFSGDLQKGTQQNQIESENIQSVNKDYYCDLIIPNSDIAFRVVRGVDNEKYLHTDFNGEENMVGSIFMDYRCDALTVPHTIIYGHDVEDLKGGRAMFGKLRQYMDENFARSHNEIILRFANQTKRYQLFAVKITDVYDESYNLDFENSESFCDFLKNIRAPKNAKEIITLSTCLGNNGKRLLVQGHQ